MKTFIALVLLFLVMRIDLHAQTVEERLSQKKPSCRDVLINAASVLPQLYAQHCIDSLEKAISFIEAVCPDNDEVFYLKILEHIERPSILMPATVDSDFIEKLNRFAFSQGPLKNNNAAVYNAEE